MRCQACGADVVQQSVYCHKCGQRLPQGESALQEVRKESGGDSATDTAASSEKAVAQPALASERLKATVAANHLAEDMQEQELWKGGYSSKAMIGTWLWTGLVTVGLLALWIWWRPSFPWAWGGLLIVLVLLWLYQVLVLTHRRMNVRYLLTTQRFLRETGMLRRVTDSMEVVEINDIAFEQGVLERLVGVGTIRVVSNDRSSPEVVMPGIENVKEVSRTIDEVRRSERRRRGLHIEQL
jgi:membrane protein YdbS with pleckstrin-like domain